MKVWTIVGLMGMMLASAQATIHLQDEVSIDLTDANCVAEHILTWSPQDKVKQGQKGLLFANSSVNTSVDFNLMTKAYPVGLSWRTTYGVNLGVELRPLGETIHSDIGMLHPSFYTVYARYSPDLKNWSSWQVMQDAHRDWQERNKAGAYKYAIQMQVPHQQRQRYNEYFSRYQKLDVPWTSDEEAMVNWLLQQEPDFFEKEIPFIGYVQFLVETSMRSNQPLAEAKVSVGWGVGGLHSPPKDESVYKNRDNVPWRYQAPDATLGTVLTPIQKKMAGVSNN